MTVRLATVFATTLLALTASMAGPVWSQSGGGLTLGTTEEKPAKLDLGAAPAVPESDSASPAAAPVAGTAPANPAPGEVVRNTYGAWEVACDSTGANCAMAQIGKDNSDTPVLEMVIRKLGEPLEVGNRTAIAVLDVITPLGVVLTEELAVTIDSGRRETAPFQICTQQGCLVREPIDNDLVNRLKRGNAAVISVIAANQGEVKSSLSLSGFTKAYNALK